MLQAMRYDEKFDSHPAAPDKEQFILRVVMVPRKCPLEFYQLYFLTVQFRGDFRPPMFRKGRELFLQVYLFHRPESSIRVPAVFVLQSPRALR